MKEKYAENNNIDPSLQSFAFLNESNQTVVFKSILHTKYPVHLYPQMWERFPKITCKPHRVVLIPHRYYTAHTRDDSPIKGREMTVNEALENYSERSIYRGEEANENYHEKKV